MTITETTDWGGSLGANGARATVFSSSGVELAQVTSNGMVDIVVPATGSYLVRVSANNLTATGSYQLSLACSQ